MTISAASRPGVPGPGASSPDVSESAPEVGLLDLYRCMARIRAFEKAAAGALAAGQLSGTLHLSVGQEAVAAGVCSALRPTDRLTTTHRGHGHCLAKGADARGMMAELFGLEEGCGKGRSGSMHLADPRVGILGANAIVGGGIAMAAGAALSAQVRGTDEVAVTFFGEGAAAEGSLHESLNLAALWRLPVLFVCENNLYAELSPITDVLATVRVADLALPFGIPAVTTDGNDVAAVHRVTREAVHRARTGGGPSFLEFETYRQSGHYEGDAQRYRTRDERREWAERDPLLVARTTLQADGVDPAELDSAAEAAAEEMRSVTEWAAGAAKAPESGVREDVYAELHVDTRARREGVRHG